MLDLVTDLLLGEKVLLVCFESARLSILPTFAAFASCTTVSEARFC